MNKKRMQSLSEYFYTELLINTMPFWNEHGTDKEYGGFTTFLDGKGEILSPDKPMWVTGRMFYAVTRDGKPLRKRRHLFTETFGVIALAEYARASGDDDCLDLAKKTMDLIVDLYDKGFTTHF